MPFLDRRDAGVRLARAMDHYANRDAVVLALPRGGVPVAAEVATALGAPLDLILVRKISVPFEPELAMGAIADANPPVVVRNENIVRLVGVSEHEFRTACSAAASELERRRRLYLGDRPPLPLEGRVAIIVDDGVATGATTRAAIRAARRRAPASIVLAVPVAPPELLAELRREADDIICLETPMHLGAIGNVYKNFAQVPDHEVIEALVQRALRSGAPRGASPERLGPDKRP
jgi:predicted phosphoribosyltransferase